ncbi:MAG: hypothetical protein K2X62_02390 [Beijerinckiaceae bacterium]|nr:hypothetical protein [Beijerinckiaceae bacterium]MDO9440687.1 hypothetical protein [Beijerinckiaceae bacterium]
MADNSGSSAILGVIIGAVLVIGIAIFFFGGFGGQGGKSTTVNVTPPAVSTPK